MKHIGKYLKDNVIVLICELVVVLLLGFICAFVVGGEPLWLAPVMAFVAYLLAELRFMMAYVATNARRERDAAPKQQPVEPAFDPQAFAAQQMYAQQFGDQQFAEQPYTDQQYVPQEQFAQQPFAEQQQMPYAGEEAYGEQNTAVADDEEDEERPVAFFTMKTPEPAAEPEEPVAPAEEPAVEESVPVQQSIDLDDEDEDGAVEALFAEYKTKQTVEQAPAEPIPVVASEEPAAEDAPEDEEERLETIEDEDYTMEDVPAGKDAPVARDVLDIGEIDVE